MKAQSASSGKYVKSGKAYGQALTRKSVSDLRRAGSYDSARIAREYVKRDK